MIREQKLFGEEVQKIKGYMVNINKHTVSDINLKVELDNCCEEYLKRSEIWGLHNVLRLI